ncbi:CPBP family intramembrane glutamic endopeptidase [Paenibacillus ginsengarvi]|nr:CPBP family intramembrane glutamic endopeptidase [Paenibacillus ginsengarvi]
MARNAKRLTHPIAVVLLSFVIVASCILLAETVAATIQPALMDMEEFLAQQPTIYSAFAKLLNLWILNIPIFFLIWCWLAGFERRPFRTLGFAGKGGFSGYLTGLFIGLLMMSAMIGLTVVANVGSFVSASGPMEGMQALGGIIWVWFGWMVQASAEETLYRGWMLQTISIRSNPWTGVVVSSVCFAAVHSLNNGFSPLVLSNLVLFGLFLALYRIADGTLWGVCAWHTIWNWALGNLYGADVSGSPPQGGRLFHITIAGPDWLTGGPFGLEGSVLTTVVFLIGIACVSVWLRKKQRKESRILRQ